MQTHPLEGNHAKVVLRGRLDAAGVDRIEAKFVATLVPHGVSAMVDLSQVDFVASLGLRMLISVARSLARKGARLVLFAPQDAVREVFEMALVSELITIRESESEALAALQG
jgi:anti-sigma B factor antagonist